MAIGRDISRGVFWVAVSTLTAQALAFATTLVTARILAVSEIGLVGMASLAIGALQMFSVFGFSEALIYRKDRVRQAADTMFVMVFLLSLILCAIALVAAPAISTFFNPSEANQPQRLQLISILRVLSVALIAGSFGQVPMTMLSKEMHFRRRLLPDIVPELVKDVLTVSLALNGFGAWSLVYGQVVDAILTSFLAWAVAPLRPRLHFHLDVAREMFAYGKHIQGSQILIFLITNLDNAFVGRLRGADDLGLYVQAWKLSNIPSGSITRLANQVMFPALARVRNDLSRLRHVYLRAVKYTALVGVPLGIAIIVFAPPFMDILYGAKWKDAILPTQILAVYGIIRSVAGNIGAVFKAGGKPQWLMGIAAWRLATMLLLLYPVTATYGIVGVSVLSAVVAVADFQISLFLCNRILHMSATDFARVLAPISALSVFSVIVARTLFALLYIAIYPPLALVLAGAVMIVVYASLVLVLDCEARQRVAGLLSRSRTMNSLLR